jgi:hypothetical protein
MISKSGWPPSSKQKPGVPDRGRRLAKLQARRAGRLASERGKNPYGTPAQRRRWFEWLAETYALVRKILGLLGHDPDAAASLVSGEASVREALAALPAAVADETAPDATDAASPPLTERSRRIKEKFERLTAYYADIATPPPDLGKESFTTIWAYVRGRVIAATRDGSIKATQGGSNNTESYRILR